MELLFIDESGDDGVVKGSSEFYILAGVAVEDIHWKETFWKLREFRNHIAQKFGLIVSEFKGYDLFSHRGKFFNSTLGPDDQKWICEQFLDLICASLKVDLHVLTKSKREFLSRQQPSMRNLQKLFRQEAWTIFLKNYEQYLLSRSKAADYPQTGLVFFDQNHEKHVRSIVRQFSRKFDLQAEFPGAGLIEDVVFYRSEMSLFVQLADFVASASFRAFAGKRDKDLFEVSPQLLQNLITKIETTILE